MRWRTADWTVSTASRLGAGAGWKYTPSPCGSNTPSMAQTWKCVCTLNAELKRWMKATAPPRPVPVGRRPQSACEGGGRSHRQDAQGRIEGTRLVMQVPPQALGHRQHLLTHGHKRQHVIDETRGRLGHAAGVAGRANAATLAREGDQEVVAAVATARAG